MVDSSTVSLITAVIVDAIIFTIFFILFLFYRKVRSPVVEIDSRYEVCRTYVHEGEYGLWDFLKKINSISLPEVNSSVGEWAFVYLTLQKYIVYTFLALGVLGCVILMPIYSVGDTKVDTSSNEVGIAHIIKQSNLLTASLISIFTFTITLYVFVYFYYRTTTYAEPKTLEAPEKYVLLISKVPQSIPYQDLNEKLLISLQNKYGKGVIDVYAIPYYYPSYSNYEKYEEAIQEKKKLRLKLKKTGKRPMTCMKKCKKIDAISSCKEKINAMKATITELKELAPNQNLGRIYVVCETEKLVNSIIEQRLDSSTDFDTKNWHFRQSTHPGDIIWKNVGKNPRCAKLLKFLYNLGFIIIFMVFLTPSTFSSYIVQFFNEVGIGDAVQGIIGIYLPSLLLMVYQQVVLPIVVGLLVKLEKHTYKHGEVSSALVKYLLFMTFYVFLFPLLGLKLIEVIQMIYGDGPNWEEEFAKSVNNTGIFFTTFIIHLTFLGNGSDLLVIPKYFKIKAKLMLAKTSREKAMAYAADPFNFDFQLAQTINIFMIACSFSLVFPIILLPSIAYFTLRYFIHKQNLLAIFYIDPNSSGYGAVFTVLCGIASSVFTMQVLSGATIMVSDAHDHSLTAKIITPAWICLLALAILWFRVLVKNRKIKSVDSQEKSDKVDIKMFFHPLDKEEVLELEKLDGIASDKKENDATEKIDALGTEKHEGPVSDMEELVIE